MKHLLSILLICSIGFTQELTVEGDLNVTGNIQSQTIDSLLQVIQDLQSQLSALQGANRMETRIFQTDTLFNGQTFNLFTDLNETITPVDFYFLEIIDIDGITIEDYTLNNATQFYTALQGAGGKQHAAVNLFLYNGMAVVGNNYYYNINGYESLSRGLFTSGGLSLSLPYNNLSCTITLAITAQFLDSNVPTNQAPAPPQNSRSAQ